MEHSMNNDDQLLYSKLVEKLIRILNMHAMNKVAKKALFHDGVYYSVKMTFKTYNDLVERLHELAKFQFQDPTSFAECSITDAWSIIDSLYRLRKLLEGTPDLKQKSPQLQLFYRQTKTLKNLRDSFQHLDEYLHKYVPYKIPAWGRLSWIYPVGQNRYKACMIAPGDIQPDWKLMPSHMGKKMRSSVDFITLTTSNSICITHMIDALEALIPWLNAQLDNNFNRKHQLVVVCFGINTNYNIIPSQLPEWQ